MRQLNLKDYDPDILLKINQLDLWRELLGYNISIGDKVCSPSFIRHDNNPNVKFSYIKGVLCLRDFTLSRPINLIDAVMAKFNMGYFDAVNYITIKGKLSNEIRYTGVNHYSKQATFKRNVVIKPTKRKWNRADRKYWYDARNITKDQLESDGVYPISEFSINNTIFNADKLAYVVYENNNKIKIYQPYCKENKWFSTITTSDFWYLKQSNNCLSDTLIITKGYKECRHIINCSTFDSLSLHAEGYNLNDECLEIISNYKYLFVMYDNDKTGYERSLAIAKQINGTQIIIPEQFNDLDQMIVESSVEYAISFLNSIKP
jgi:hypothetical protein